MGQVNGESQPPPQPVSSAPSPPPLTHFSHPHPLYPTPIYNNPQQAPPHCSACGQSSTAPSSYTCQPCNFTLHKSCAQLPRRITHVSHGECRLSLITKPIYPGAVFSCDACAQNGFAWSYHCERCSFDLHVTCAAKPLKIRHQAHASCELHLTFTNPYAGSDEFSCDICRRIGSKQWLYRCNSCGFDIHMDCTTRVVMNNNAHHQNPHLMHSASTGSVNYQQPAAHHQPHMLMHSASTGAMINHPQATQPYYTMNGVNPGGVVMGNQPMMNGPNNYNNNNNGLGSNLMMTAFDGLVNGVFQGVGQTMAQDLMSGGGGGGGDGGGGSDGGGGGEVYTS